MSESAKLLRFPDRRRPRQLSSEEVSISARHYLDTPLESRGDFRNEFLGNPDVLLNILDRLRELTSISPTKAAQEAEEIYSCLNARASAVGLFDEKDYFTGSAALIAGGAVRLAGDREAADIWFDRAEAAFLRTVNCAPSLASVGYARMCLHYDRRSYGRVLDQIPRLLATFEQFGMVREQLKTRFLEALTLKESSRIQEALEKLNSLEAEPELDRERELAALVVINMAELLTEVGRHADAAECCKRAISRLERENRPIVVGHLFGVQAIALRNQGRSAEAVKAFRISIESYAKAGFRAHVAYLRIVLAETLISIARYREAEWEILAALPTIEEQKMVPEGFAAVALLKESVRRRKTDPNALRELREHLQANR